MIAAGLLTEVKALLAAGYKPTLPALSGLGYRQLTQYLAGKHTLQEAIQRIQFETHRFARQQYTWFRLDDPTITWFNTQEDDWMTAVFKEVTDFLNNNSTHE